jgi:hypothetical protein
MEPLRIFHSKANDFATCRRKYHLRHHLHLVPRRKPFAFVRGEIGHSGCEYGLEFLKKNPHTTSDEAITYAIAKMQPLFNDIFEEDDKDIAVQILMSIWPIYAQQNFVQVEQVWEVQDEAITPYGAIPYTWIIKPDGAIKDGQGTWQAELKTVEKFTKNTIVLYFESIQLWTYLHILHKYNLIESAQGIKLFIGSVPPKRLPKGATEMPTGGYIEEMPFDKVQMRKAELYVNEIVGEMFHAEELAVTHPGIWWKNRNQCRNIFGTCAYAPLCEPYMIEGSESWELGVNASYKIEHPEDHLYPKEENGTPKTAA